MNKSIFCAVLALISGTVFSQQYDFHVIKDIEVMPVTSQDDSNTCWSFSTTSFLEAEIIRQTGKKIDLSEMYTVRNTYLDKAENYVMRQGKANFDEGGLSHDLINTALKYGVVPEKNFLGKVTTTDKFDHSKMVKELKSIVDKAVKQTPKKYPEWKTDFNAVLDSYLGKLNENEKLAFPKNGIDSKTVSEQNLLTPKQFLAATKLNLHDYVSITTFTNQPYYSKFILNIPDNFANGFFYNLPLDEFIQNIDNAIDKGFTLTISIDVTEKTFSKENGIAVIPANEEDSKVILTEIKPEKIITPEYRQSEFENYDTQDDHSMHIVGKVTDQNGNRYYKVKNSWGTKLGKDGYFYISVPYMRLKAIAVTLHKDGLTKKSKASLKL